MSYELSGAQERKRNNESKAKEYYDKVRKQEQEVVELKRQLDAKGKEATALQNQKGDLDAKTREVTTKLEGANRNLSWLRSQIASKEQGIRKDQGDMEKYQEEVVRLDRKIADLMKHR